MKLSIPWFWVMYHQNNELSNQTTQTAFGGLIYIHAV